MGRYSEVEAQFERLWGVSHVKYAIAELSRTDRGEDIESVSGSMLYAFQQLSGINAVFYFSSAVFNSVGVPSDVANACVGLSNFVGSMIAMILMDKVGRKVLLLGSFLGMAVAMYLQVMAASVPSQGSVYLSVGGMLLFVLMFALGAGPVPGLLLPEILPNQIRAKAIAICLNGEKGFMYSELTMRVMFRLQSLIVQSVKLPNFKELRVSIVNVMEIDQVAGIVWFAGFWSLPMKADIDDLDLSACICHVVNFFVGLLFLHLLEQLGPQKLYSMFASNITIEEINDADNVKIQEVILCDEDYDSTFPLIATRFFCDKILACPFHCPNLETGMCKRKPGVGNTGKLPSTFAAAAAPARCNRIKRNPYKPKEYLPHF
ncbi:hypothetical protein ACLOJK_021199 [Asimina triloba]